MGDFQFQPPKFCILGQKFSDKKIFRQAKILGTVSPIATACHDATDRGQEAKPIFRSCIVGGYNMLFFSEMLYWFFCSLAYVCCI